MSIFMYSMVYHVMCIFFLSCNYVVVYIFYIPCSYVYTDMQRASCTGVDCMSCRCYELMGYNVAHLVNIAARVAWIHQDISKGISISLLLM